MAFTADSFIFDGVSSEEFGLYLYSFNRQSQNNGVFGGSASILESRLSARPSPLHYGVVRNDPAEFDLIFGTVDSCPIDRFKAAAIAQWLVGHQDYRWLQICQNDLDHVSYKCIVDSLEQLPVNNDTVAFLAKVRCDSPYAYSALQEIEISSALSSSKRYFSPSNIHDPHYPIMEITVGQNTTDVSIWTDRDTDHKFELSDLQISTQTVITVDNLNQVISGGEENWYKHFNFNFLRIWPGENIINVNGNCSVKIFSRPFMNVGY